MTLPARLRAHEPTAIREVHDAIIASRGVLADIGRRLALKGNATAAAGRIVALAGLDQQLAAVQQEHGTGGSGRRPRARVRVLVQITGAPLLDTLTPDARSAYVYDRGPGPQATAYIEVDATGKIRGGLVPRVIVPELDETGRVSGRLVKEG